jgi:3-hydroxybutyryl-CoA dehydratase
MEEDIPPIAQGKHWEELQVGWKGRTHRRTVTESDLIAFISATGMLELTFIDAAYDGAIGGRPVPAALTHCFIEGFQLQSLVQGTGLALLEANIVVDGPVRVGDSIGAIVEVLAVRPTSKFNRAVVSFLVTVFNQDDEQVMHYDVKRLISGRNRTS